MESDFWVKVKIVFDRGRSWIGYLTFLMMVFVTITSMKEYPYFAFLAGRYWFFLVLVSGVALIFVLGYLELRTFHVYQKELEIYSRINPVQKKVFENQEKILERLDKLEKKK
ncbi:MAG: hypothetical protein ABH950_10190 [Candidatus Altiarchaeota archaeon]